VKSNEEGSKSCKDRRTTLDCTAEKSKSADNGALGATCHENEAICKREISDVMEQNIRRRWRRGATERGGRAYASKEHLISNVEGGSD